MHFFAAAFFAVLKLFMHTYLSQLLPWASPRAARPPYMIFSLAYLTYWEIIAIAHGVDYYHKYREKALRATQLESSLAKAQVNALKMQLQPHFLFNTLHSISTLMHENVEAADDMLTFLSDLLRQSLETGGAQKVPLRKEIEFLQTYLDIQRIRFRDRLAFRINIDPEALDALVPNFLLPPLVENAVLHGISRMEAAGEVSIGASQYDGVLYITIKDNGPGLMSNSDNDTKKGIGLHNTRTRLAQLYGDRHTFELRDNNGVEVKIGVPFHTRPMGEPPG
ncbi:MAG: sensor histidine kinase [bacterium]